MHVSAVTRVFLQVVKYKRGKTKIMNFFVGQVQNELSRRADGRATSMIFQRLLSRDTHKD